MTFAFIFESVGGTEWLVLLGVVLIVVGPKNLPSAARKLGNIMSTLRRAADEFKRQLLSMDEEFRKAVDDSANETSAPPPPPPEDDPSTVPDSADVPEEDGSAYVWAEKNGRLEKRGVIIGEYNYMLDTVEILEGLTGKDYIAFPNEELCVEGAPTTRTEPEIEAEGGAA